VQSILINSALTIIACFVLGVGNVTAVIRSCALAPWNMSKMLRYIPLISFMWKLVLKLELFLLDHHYFSLYIYCSATNNLLDPNSAASIAYHMLKLKDSDPHMEVLSWDLHL
jgi:hypothetical protein